MLWIAFVAGFVLFVWYCSLPEKRVDGAGRRYVLGGLLSSPLLLLVGCAAEEVVLGEWEVGPDEHGHRLYGFAQAKGGPARVLFVHSTDEHGRGFSGPLIVSMPRLASERYDPESNRALEFQVWDDSTGEWQWLGVSTLDRIVQTGERYRVVRVEDTVTAVETWVPDDVRERAAAETNWALGTAA